jgi:serine/threonine protein kinase
MGNMLQTLHQKANILWELLLPRKYLDGNNITCDPERLNTIVTSLNVNSSSKESEITTPESYIARYPTLRYYAQEQVRFGRKFAAGVRADIYEAELVSTSTTRPLPVVVKKFKGLPGVIQGLFPVEFDIYKNMYVCRPAGFFFDYEGSLCMITERYSGDLRDLIDSQMELQGNVGPPFIEPVAVSIIIQLALGLRSLHDSKIYHRDLKCKNILVQRNRKEMLIPSGALGMDFAVAISGFETSDDVEGTGFWRAPEVLLQLQKHEGNRISGIQWDKADVYSFGMTCYEILTGRSPFYDKNLNDYDAVLSGGRPELPANVPLGLREIIQDCWDENPNVRPTFGEIKTLLKNKYKEIWDVGFSKVESVMKWESSIGTPDAMLLELETLIDKIEWNAVSKFVDTVKEFVSEFGWSSFVIHPSLPFGKFVEREMFYTLMSSQYAEECDIYHEFVQADDADFETKSRVFLLMEKVFFSVTERAWKSKYFDED